MAMLSFLNLIIRLIAIPFVVVYYFLVVWTEPLKRKSNKVNSEKSWRKTNTIIKSINWCSGVKIVTVNKPKETENVVYVSNHGSIMDGTVVTEACGKKVRAILAGEVWYSKIPFFKSLVWNSEHIMVDRTSLRSSVQSLRKLKEQVKKERPVLIFPEGIVTDRTQGELVNKFKQGAFDVANDLQVPIRPLVCTGLAKYFPDLITAKMLFQRTRTGTVTFLPIYDKHLHVKMTNKELSDEIWKIIESEVRRIEE